MMKEVGIAGDVGLATGYVLKFSNGLVAYLSGDTGVTADQERVVRDLFEAVVLQLRLLHQSTSELLKSFNARHHVSSV